MEYIARTMPLRTIFVLFALMTGSFLWQTECHAVDITYDTALEAAYTNTYKDIFYDRVAGSPLEAEAEEGVDPSTGHLILKRTDLFLEGTGGMDLELSRYYNSNNASIGCPLTEHVDSLKVKTYNVFFETGEGKRHSIAVAEKILDQHPEALKGMIGSYNRDEVEERTERTETNTQRTRVVSSYEQNVYGISTGWAFDFPWIETMSVAAGEESGWEEKPLFLHMGSKGTMAISTKAEESAKRYSVTGLAEYPYEDIRLEDFRTIVDGVECRYLLRDKMGMRTYFNKDGVIVLQRDAHGNAIHYTYRDKMHFDTITDSVGRKIQFHYGAQSHGMQLLEKITVEGPKTTGGVSEKTVCYNLRETSYTTMDSKKLYGSVLNSVIVSGRKESYGYHTVESLVNAAGAGVASQRAATNETYLIKSVEGDGSTNHYEYRAGAIRGTRDTDAGQERDVVTQFFYVTREYTQDGKTKKKAGGTKYDYFQRQNGKLVTFDDVDDEAHEVWQYGEEGLHTAAVISSYNPAKHKDNGKMSDYTYKRAKLDEDTLQLKSKPKKQVNLYLYNQNRLVENQINEGSGKSETLSYYDHDGAGSLVVLEVEKDYGKKRKGTAKTEKRGFTYDRYRNVLTEKAPKAYLPKYKGKESLFTQTITYFNLYGGYPKEDKGYTLAAIQTCESYTSATVKCRTVNTLSPDGTSIATEEEQVRKGNAGYQTKSRVEYTYDAQGNEIKGVEYPDRVSDRDSYTSSIYQYNGMGQLLRQEREIHSVKDSSQNKNYVLESFTYDFFGNELTRTDQNGITDKTVYDEETGAEDAVTYDAGSSCETEEKTYTSEDHLSSMTLDQYGRCTVEIEDAFGNTVIQKSEEMGTWTESEYDYGEEDAAEEDEEEDSATAPEARLVEERVYPFDPSGEPVTKSKDGTEEAHYDIGGKGKEILSASRYQYDDYGEEIVSAEFSGGAIDAAHCSSWVVSRTEEETGEEQTVVTTYQKMLDPAAYQRQVDPERYYTKFDTHVLSETMTTTVEDEEGNILSETVTVSCDGEKRETVTTSEYDDFGLTTSDHSIMRDYRDGKWQPAQEIKNSYEYDEMGNLTVTTTQSRLSDKEKWEKQVTKNQLITTEYDDQDQVTAIEEQLTEDTSSRTEYEYNEQGQLTCVKTCLDEGKYVYVQYVYDTEGNKIRQFTGMTKPLSITVCEGEGEDGYTYAGKKYHIEVTGGEKKDKYSETKYTYNKKNQLTSITDPEGYKETYTYDVYGNLTRTVDRNGTVSDSTFDYQGRLLTQKIKDPETGKETEHKYLYDKYGNLARADGVSYTYNNLTELILQEKEKAAGKTIQKTYTYDGSDNCRSFQISAGGKTELSLSYEYDGFSRLTRVDLHDGDIPEKIAAYTYDEDGSLVTAESGAEGPSARYTYNCAGDITGLVNRRGSGQTISAYTDSYRLNGQKISEKETRETGKGEQQTKTAAYTYDRMGRLLTESRTGEESISYTYDSHNNRKTITQGNKQTAYRYDRNDRLQRTDVLNTKTKEDTVTLYKYDPSGNQLAEVHRRQTGGDSPVFDLDVTLGANRLNDNVVSSYDPEDRLVRTLTGDKKVSYTYDDDGYRTSKTVNGKTIYYIWDDDQIVMELNDKGEVSRRYLRGNSLICADTGKNTDRQYYATNPHGDTVQLLDQKGKIVREYEYDAFGNESRKDKKDDNPYRYAGEYYDRETGTIYLRARYYEPELGRFTTRDTYTGEEDDPMSLHLYTYCDNDGVNQTDPSGHWGSKEGFGYEGDGFVHKSITMEALGKYSLRETMNSSFDFSKSTSKYVSGIKTKYGDVLLDGSIYPDFIEAKKELNKSKKSKKKKRIEKAEKKIERYENSIKGTYVDYTRKIFKGFMLWDDVMFHGKSKKKRKELEKVAKAKFKCSGHKTEKFLLLGCVLHSIQDYSAHSYYGDLETFRKSKNKNKFSQKKRAFHSDWLVQGITVDKNGKKKTSKETARTRRNSIHSKYKDNPHAVLTYNKIKGLWEWDTVGSVKEAKKTKRYVKALNDSTSYLQDVLKCLK